MGLYSGTPRRRHRGSAKAGSNLVRCGICGTSRDISTRMVYAQIDVPGYPNKRMLVHPQCKDQPHPRAHRPRPRPERPAEVIQPLSVTYSTTDIGGNTHAQVAVPTITAVVWAATGAASATVAQVTADPTVTVTGTGFTTRTVGRVNADANHPEHRTTTYSSATSVSFEVRTADIVAGTLTVDVFNSPPPWTYTGTQHSNNEDLTIT